MYEVKVVFSKDLSEEEKDFELPDNGCGKESAHYLVVSYNDKVIRVESDAMEPEDATFFGDLDWVASALKEAYKIGFTDCKRNIMDRINSMSVEICFIKK